MGVATISSIASLVKNDWCSITTVGGLWEEDGKIHSAQMMTKSMSSTMAKASPTRQQGGMTNKTVAANSNSYHDRLTTPILEDTVVFIFIHIKLALSDYDQLKFTHQHRCVYQNDSFFQKWYNVDIVNECSVCRELMGGMGGKMRKTIFF